MKEKEKKEKSTMRSSSLCSLLDQCTYEFEKLYGPKFMAKISPLQLEQTPEEEEQKEIKDHTKTAENIASECLEMLQALQQSFDVIEYQEGEDEDEDEQELTTDTTNLQDEVDALASELASAIRILVPNVIDKTLEHSLEASDVVIPHCPSKKEKDKASSSSLSLVHPFGRPTKTVRERMLLIQKKKEAKEKERRKMVLKRKRQRSIAKRLEDQVYNTPLFWRDHQSKSFQTHIQRQQQARQIQQQKKEQENELSAIRFRGVSTKKSPELNTKKDTLKSATSIVLSRSSTKSYLQSYKDQQPTTSSSSLVVKKKKTSVHLKTTTKSQQQQQQKKEILVSVYRYGHRSHHHHSICTDSMEDFKLKVQYKLQMDKFLNVYKERACITQLNGKYSTYKRINCFSQLKYGDILCVTTSPYEDMAILCEWIKKRQTTTTNPAQEVQIEEDYKSQPKKQVWDTNGRLVGVKQTVEFPPESEIRVKDLSP